jgi:predicted kinase
MRKFWYSIGLSGSGKSYYYKNSFLIDFPEVADFLLEKVLTLEDIKVCPDDIRREVCGDVNAHNKEGYVWRLAEKRVKDNLDKYGYALFDATGTSKKARKIVKKFKADEKIALVFKPDAKLSISRISNDINEGVDRSKVHYRPYVKSIVTENPYIISCYSRNDVFVLSNDKWVNPDIQTYGASVNIITNSILMYNNTIPLLPLGGASYKDKIKTLKNFRDY